MKKAFFFIILMTSSLFGIPKAVIFDYGNVLAFHNRDIIVQHFCHIFHITPQEFEDLNKEQKASGKSVEAFWLEYAKHHDIEIPYNWPQIYRKVLRDSLGIDHKMYCLIDELKEKHLRVGLLSNIEKKYGSIVQSFGFYAPFDPCLLSYEIGAQKPETRAYLILLQKLNCLPQEIVFIDDKIENVDAAKKLKIDAIVFKSEADLRKELIKRGISIHP